MGGRLGRKGEDGLWYNTSLLPRINDKHRGKNYCYVYLETAANAGSSSDYSDMALVKKDVCTDTPLKVWHIDFHYPSEPQFVPTMYGSRCLFCFRKAARPFHHRQHHWLAIMGGWDTPEVDPRNL